MENQLVATKISVPAHKIIFSYLVDSYTAMCPACEMQAEVTYHSPAESLRAGICSTWIYPSITGTSNVPDHPGSQSEDCVEQSHYQLTMAI